MQTFTLPSAFATETLDSIVFYSQGGHPQGKAFLAAATVASNSGAVPEGGEYCLVMGLLTIVGCQFWLRRAAVTGN
ncbi:MAG TPA: hypothetical protein P5186_01405 [Candidatus Paceibacterota bacterium]|nr:hypothetical protein [Verrucomicrobiota bacterium]HRY46678.1 hypothetical protein [Candidatus Paceibacterota bacterium]